MEYEQTLPPGAELNDEFRSRPQEALRIFFRPRAVVFSCGRAGSSVAIVSNVDRFGIAKMYETIGLEGGPVRVAKEIRQYQETSTRPATVWNGKPVIDWGREKPIRVVAELAIVHEFRESGWDAYWISSNGVRDKLPEEGGVSSAQFLKSEPPFARFPEVLNAKRLTGTWDVLAWKGNEIRFIEAKRKNRDALQRSQKAFLEKILASHGSLDMFMVIEWTLISAQTQIIAQQ